MKPFKPLLAGTLKTIEDYDNLKFPIIATPKLDGIRILKREGEFQTRSLKPIRNVYIQRFARFVPDNLDGEIITYWDEACTKMKEFNDVQSDVMRSTGEPYWRFHAFDDFTYPDMAYEDRLEHLFRKSKAHECIVYVPHTIVYDVIQLCELAIQHLADGWEGTMIRDPKGLYKYGRSSVKQAILLKIKKFDDDEGKIIGYTEMMHNTNEAVTNNLGRTERSTHAEGLIPAGLLGAWKISWNGLEFDCGSGYDMQQRAEMWDNREDYIGKMVTFKFQGVGTNGRPRFPIYLGIRLDLD